MIEPVLGEVVAAADYDRVVENEDGTIVYRWDDQTAVYYSQLEEPKIRLVTKTARDRCQHESSTEFRKNRFKCEACGYEYRMVKQSVLKRGLYLRSARSLHRGN